MASESQSPAPLSAQSSLASTSSTSTTESLFNDEAEQSAAQRFVIEVQSFRKEAPIALEARGSMTVTRLAEKVAAEDGSSIEEQLLHFNDEEIFDGRWGGMDLRRSRMLAPFGITEKSSIVQKDPGSS